uniref:peptide-methionine (S)-S-oxide reductase n=1 Tax=Panagrellus redivivus TaxID=6233 RepID=A0A7E4VBG6_PANRE
MRFAEWLCFRTATSPAMSLKSAVFGVQCFWGSESAFAKLNGVVKTRVGYAGGTTPNPTYRAISDYTEVVEAQFDDSVVSYQALLDYFWKIHNPSIHRKKQYQSAILYVDEEQKLLAEASLARVRAEKPDIETYIAKLDHFYPAEDYHQKYWLRCQDQILSKLKLSDAEIIDSPLTAKINAFLAGFDNYDVLHQLAEEYKLSDSVVKQVEEIARAGGDPRACH